MTTTNPMLAELDEVVRLMDAATPLPWRWSENGNIMAEGDRDVDEIAAVYTEHDDDSEPANSSAIRAATNFLRTHHATLADMAKRLEAAERDAARIEWLQQEVDEIGAFLLHNGAGKGSGFTGLGLKNTGRTLRQAVDACMPQPIIDATQEGEG